MRLISQNGAIDVPYDYFSLTIATGKYEDVEVSCIYCHNLSSPKGTKLAEYSSKEKAEKAMEMLSESYNNYVFAINLFSDEMLKSYANSHSKEEFNELAYPYFRFPADEDLEV